MNENEIIFSIIKIKRDAAIEWPQSFPEGFIGWTNYNECRIFAELYEKLFGKRIVFSSNFHYLDHEFFKALDSKRIGFAKSYNEVEMNFSYLDLSYVREVFLKEHFRSVLLREMLEAYREECENNNSSEIKKTDEAIKKLINPNVE